MVEENRMYKQLQKMCSEKVCLPCWPANLGKFCQNILCTPKKLPAPILHLWFTDWVVGQPTIGSFKIIVSSLDVEKCMQNW